MQVFVIGAAVGHAVDQIRVAMKGKDDGFVRCKQGVEVLVGQAVGMLFSGL
jgi:hypothetical protein